MSDLHTVGKKLEEGANWRGTIRVSIGGEEHELTIRQLKDPEWKEVRGQIDRDELQELREEMPQEEMEELQELRGKEELDEDEQQRFEELEELVREEAPDPLAVLSDETFNAIRQTAKYAVEPDEEDKRQAFMERADEIEREYKTKVQTPEDVEEALQDEIEEMIDKSTNMASFTIGMQALVETVGDEGN